MLLSVCTERKHYKKSQTKYLDRDLGFLLLLVLMLLTGVAVIAVVVVGVVSGTTLASIAIMASLTLFMASSTSLFASWAVGPWGFTMAFLLWFTLCVSVCVCEGGSVCGGWAHRSVEQREYLAGSQYNAGVYVPFKNRTPV